MTNLFTNTYRNKYLPLLSLITVFLVIRSLILLSGVDNIVFDLETNVGTLSKVLIDGNSLALVFNLSDNYRGGAIIFGMLTVPFFLLFGESLLVLKAVAMFFSLGTLILLYLFLYDFFTRRAAILASLFFILAPPNYIRFAFVPTGGYTEINLFSILAIFVFYKIFFAEGANRRDLYAFFGAVSGLALYYDYIFLLTLSCCMLLWFNFNRGFLLKKNFYIFMLFFFIGFSPWIYYNLTHNWNAVFIMRGEPLLSWFAKNSFLGSLIRIKNLIISEIPDYLCYRNFLFISKNLISFVSYFILAISFIGIFWLQRKSIAGFLKGLMPLGSFRKVPRTISRETPLIIYIVVFVLAYSFCGTSHLDAREGDTVFPHRFVVFIVPFIFMITAIFLDKITSNKYGVFVSRILAGALIIVSFISNLGMISLKNYRISTLPDGYNYISFGKQSRYMRGDNITQLSDLIGRIDKKYRRFFYDGYRWAVPKDVLSIKDYVQKKMVSIDKDCWPFAYEYLGSVMGQNLRYNKNTDEELKSHVDKVFYPYFFLGLGRSFANKGLDENEYNYILGIIDKQYWRYFHEGIGIEMDAMFSEDIKKFNQFISTTNIEARKEIYGGFAKGREYPRMSYRIFSSAFGKIVHSIKSWEGCISGIEEEFKPYCYQRLGIEIGWRFIYGIKEYQDFLQKVNEKYKPNMYLGVGTAIGWRFGYNISGCEMLIKQLEQEYRTYVYEGLGIGVAKRYGYQLDERSQDIETKKVPAEHRDQFRKGLKEAVGI